MGKPKGGARQWDYYGTIALAICAGPVKRLYGIEIDSKNAWPAAEKWKPGASIPANALRFHRGVTWKAKSTHTPVLGNDPPNATLWDPYYLEKGVGDSTAITIPNRGNAVIYWGTQTQTVDPRLTAGGNDAGEQHPAFKGVCYLVFYDFLMGRERPEPPASTRCMIEAEPAQSIVTSTPATVVDGNANTVAATVAALVDPVNGIGWDPAQIDATTAQATADSLQTIQDLVGCSPLLDGRSNFRGFIESARDISDIWLRWNPSTRKIEFGRWTHGTAPATFHSLTVGDFGSDGVPRIKSGSFNDIKTGYTVNFTDGERSGKNSSDGYNDPAAAAILRRSSVDSVSRPWITRRAQAIAHAAQLVRIKSRPQMAIDQVQVRREKGKAIKPGDWVQIDIDVEPGGAQLLQFFKVIQKVTPRRGPVTLTLDADETLAPIPYTPLFTPTTVPADEDVAPVVNARIFEVTPTMTGGAKMMVSVLAERPASNVVGAQLWFNTASTGPFQLLDDFPFFALRAVLRTDHAGSATGPMPIALPNQLDLEKLGNSITSAEASDDTWLAIVFQIASGQINTDNTGSPFAEIMSISDIAISTPITWASGLTATIGQVYTDAGVTYRCILGHTTSGGNRPANATYWEASPNNYDLTVLRGRQGTSKHSFSRGDTEVWIIQREALRFFSHAEIKNLRTNIQNGTTPDTGYFLIQTNTYSDSIELTDPGVTPFAFKPAAFLSSAPIITITEPTWTSQSYANGLFTPTPLPIDIDGFISDNDGDLEEVSIVCSHNGGAEVQLYRATPSPTFHQFSITYTLSAVGTHFITIRARDKFGWLTQSYLLITGNAAIAKVPGVNLAIVATDYGGAISYVAPGSTQPRAYWDSSVKLYKFGVLANIASAGAFEVIATATSTTTAPSSGYSALDGLTYSPGFGGSTSAYHRGTTNNDIVKAGISSAFPGAFKLWIRATNPGNDPSDAVWIKFQ